MATTADTIVVFNQYPWYVVRLLASGDADESAVQKIDKSTLALLNGDEPKALDLWDIQYSIAGFDRVMLLWDNATDDEMISLSGNGFLDWSLEGGLRMPANTSTGDVLLTTSGAEDPSHYSITAKFRMRAA